MIQEDQCEAISLECESEVGPAVAGDTRVYEEKGVDTWHALAIFTLLLYNAVLSEMQWKVIAYNMAIGPILRMNSEGVMWAETPYIAPLDAVPLVAWYLAPLALYAAIYCRQWICAVVATTFVLMFGMRLAFGSVDLNTMPQIQHTIISSTWPLLKLISRFGTLAAVLECACTFVWSKFHFKQKSV